MAIKVVVIFFFDVVLAFDILWRGEVVADRCGSTASADGHPSTVAAPA
jgi:hypothetical protein